MKTKPPANGFPKGTRVRVVIPKHRWNGLVGVVEIVGGNVHYIKCDTGRAIAPVFTSELKAI